MPESLPPIEMTAPPRRWTRLARRAVDAGSPRLLLGLAVPVGLVGYGLLALLALGVGREGDGVPWVMAVVAVAFAAVATLMLYAGVRGLRGRSLPAPEVALEAGVALQPGARAWVRVRQGGPVSLERLTVEVVCERRYRRPLGGRSKGSVDDVELLWGQRLLEITDQPIAAGRSIERELELRLPADARPSGGAAEGGQIRWAIEVRAEAGFLRATYHPFALDVQGRAAEA